MASVNAISSVIQSVTTYLHRAYEHSALSSQFRFSFTPVSSNQLAPEEEPNIENSSQHRVTVYLYRVSLNQHGRNHGHPRNPNQTPVPLALDLHLLFSVWTSNPSAEHLVIAWLMRELQLHPILDRSFLDSGTDWATDEIIHLIPSELTTEDMMRIWDALTPSYRLSVSYIARTVRIDPEEQPETSHAPVVIRRLEFTEPGFP
jgi:hypothetical protein